MRKYFLKAFWRDEWDEVTLAAYIVAERDAGFYPKHGYGPCATQSFSTPILKGKIENDDDEG
jgi:hypothetical protein